MTDPSTNPVSVTVQIETEVCGHPEQMLDAILEALSRAGFEICDGRIGSDVELWGWTREKVLQAVGRP